MLNSTPFPLVSPIALQIDRSALSAGVDRLLAINIAYAESGLDPEAQNASSTAEGIYQILKGTWEAYDCSGDRLNATDNINCAMKIMKQSGYHAWDASAKTWLKLPYTNLNSSMVQT